MLLRDWRKGNRAALDELVPLVYARLYELAAGYMRDERPGHMLGPTALVSEAYVRLAEAENPDWQDRIHFYAIAARTMRQILVDHARSRDSAKRGGSANLVELDAGLATTDRPAELLAVDEALERLAELDERKARILELRYFGGLTHSEIAEVLAVHSNTVAREQRLAEAWIRRHLSDREP